MKKIRVNPVRLPAFMIMWLPSITAVIILWILKSTGYTGRPNLTWAIVFAPIWTPLLLMVIIGLIILAACFIKGIPEGDQYG